MMVAGSRGVSWRHIPGILAVTVATSLTWFAPVHAQGAGMPIFLVEGNQYERRTFDAEGTLEGLQKLEISQVSRVDEELEITVISRSFDTSGEATDSVQTTIRCRPESASMVMNLLALVEPEGRSVRLRLKGDEIAYPTAPDTTLLPDISLEAKVEEGVVGFLGGRSQIVLTNRMVADPIAVARGDSDPEGAYSIISRIEMRFYVLGIRVRSKSYDAVETVAPGRGLIRQVLTAEDGSYTSLTLVS